MAQALPNPDTMSAAFQRSSQALATAATELSNASVAHNNLADEVARFPQLPAFQAQELQHQMGAILTEIREMRTEMREQRTELRTEMRELRTELRTEMRELRTELHTEMHAGFYNTSAMLANQRVTQPDQPLRPLRNSTTNLPIPNFPRDLTAVLNERSPNVFRQILIELGGNPPAHNWTIVTARQDFRQAIGCNPV